MAGKNHCQISSLGGGRIFLFEQTLQEYARVPCGTVLVMEFHHPLKLSLQFRQNRLREGNGPVLLPLAVVDGEDAGGAIAMMQPQLQPFEQAATAALQPLDHQGRGRRELLQNGLNFLPGEHNRDVSRAPRPGHVPVVAAILLQHMPEQEQPGIERLVLRGSGDLALDRQRGELCFDLYG